MTAGISYTAYALAVRAAVHDCRRIVEDAPDRLRGELECRRLELLQDVEDKLEADLCRAGVGAEVAALSAVQFVGHCVEAWTRPSR